MLKNLNRLANCKNGFQGNTKKVLCVCSAGLLRSPTAAVVLSQPPFNYNTRAAGVSSEFALVPVDEVLVAWADEIVCMEEWQRNAIQEDFNTEGKKIIVLDVDDCYEYRHPELMEQIKSKYNMATALATPNGQCTCDETYEGCPVHEK